MFATSAAVDRMPERAARPAPTDGFSSLLHTVKGYLTGTDVAAETHVDDDYVLEMLAEAVHHKLVPLVASRYRLHPRLSKPMRLHLRDLHGVAAHRLRVYVHEALKVQELLRARGTPVAFRKGMVLSHWIYRSPADRHCSDIDAYCLAADGQSTVSALTAAGWKVGEHDTDRQFRKLTPAETVFSRLFPDHLPRLMLETDDLLEPCVPLDFSVDFAWSEAPMASRENFLRRELRDADSTVNGLYSSSSLSFHFLDVALHLYRDAFFEKTIREKKDVHLSKFLDLEIIWRRMRGKVARLKSSIAELEAADTIAWVTHHVDSIFGSGITDTLGLRDGIAEGRVRPCTWQDANAQIREWEGTMIERLRAKSRPGSVVRKNGLVP